MNEEPKGRLHTLFYEFSGKEISIDVAKKLNEFVDELVEETLDNKKWLERS